MKSSRLFLRKMIISVLALAVMLGAVSCGENDEEGSSTFITVGKDGTIQSEIVESFAEERYDKDELQQMILGEVSAYNNKAGSDNITVEKVDMDGSEVVVKMTYVRSRDYAAFNKETFFAGLADDAEVAGYELNVVLSGVKDAKETVGRSDILTMEDTGLLITNSNEEIHLEGKALYVSDGVEYSANGKTVRRIADGEKMIYVLYSTK
ncbi:MAG: hypothetical protein NC400_10090 [Clostridium sp.]|nr:hypothetical protein [Clostridium sp.]